MKKSKFLKLIAVILALLCLCSCANNKININSFVMPETVKKLESGTIAENDNFSLLWDSDRSCVVLYNRINGNIWSSIPYEYYNNTIPYDGYKDLNFASPIYLVCRTRDKGESNEIFSNELTADNTVYSLKLKDGLRVIYMFEDVKVSIPVEYRLLENGLEARILVNEIAEKDNLVYKISLMPFFASTKNSKDSYLFVPSGSGAIMYTDEARNVRNYSEPVYGVDETYQQLQELSSQQKVHLPVFGVKNSEDTALLGVIDKGSELGVIDATAGDKLLGYSAVYPSFEIRSISETAMKSASNTTSIITKVTPGKADIDYVSVKYFPLYGEDADYNGMANTYRKYLLNTKQLSGEEKSSGLFLNAVGGINVKQSFLGVPYKKVLSATTLAQAEEIVGELSEETGLDIVLKLSGFGKGGIDSKLLGGEFKLDAALGNKKALKKLHSTCQSKDVPLIMNFDILYYGKSSNGYSISQDCAKNANGLGVKKKRYSMVTHQEGYQNESLSLLNRAFLFGASEKMLKKTKKLSFDGVSLATLGEVAFGDGKNISYIAENGITNDVQKILKNIKANKRSVATQNANLYAALLSDYIYSAPTDSSGYLFFDKDIPFYQMVFKGHTSMSSKPVNLSNDVRKEFLKAISTGSSVEFTVCYDFKDEFINTFHSGISASCYKDIKKDIIDMCGEAEDVLKAVKGAEIEKYTYNDDVSCTQFSNGVKVYVNYGNTAAKTEIGNIEPYSFNYTERGE